MSINIGPKFHLSQKWNRGQNRNSSKAVDGPQFLWVGNSFRASLGSTWALFYRLAQTGGVLGSDARTVTRRRHLPAHPALMTDARNAFCARNARHRLRFFFPRSQRFICSGTDYNYFFIIFHD